MRGPHRKLGPASRPPVVVPPSTVHRGWRPIDQTTVKWLMSPMQWCVIILCVCRLHFTFMNCHMSDRKKNLCRFVTVYTAAASSAVCVRRQRMCFSANKWEQLAKICQRCFSCCTSCLGLTDRLLSRDNLTTVLLETKPRFNSFQLFFISNLFSFAFDANRWSYCKHYIIWFDMICFITFLCKLSTVFFRLAVAFNC